MTKKLYPINNLGGGGFAGGEAAHKSPIHSFLLRRCQKPIYGGLEGGGTKFVCMVGRGPEDVIAEARIPTAAPGETIPPAIAFFEKFSEHGLTAIGLAPFGPLDLDRDSPTYGQISATPKQGWAHTDITGMFRKAFSIPIALDVDVGAAAFGEYYWAAKEHACDPLVYFTIGTGIGAGIVANGQIVHGLVHPEGGHVRIPHDWQKDPYPGNCPFHGDCFEGLACGPAIAQRWGQPAETLPDEHPAWELEASYIALAISNIICTLSPKRIILGGGVMARLNLFPSIRSKVQALLNRYIVSPILSDRLDDLILPPILGKRSGVLGAIALAKALAGRD